MKKKFSFAVVLFVVVSAQAQETKRIESLDSFFAGIPLQKNYTDWVLHINGEPQLGIDSIGARGLYSSFKQSRAGHFPFPDSIPVKLLLYTAISIDSLHRFPNDTIYSLTIEGIFGNNKKARKDADTYFKQLRSILSNYYKENEKDPSGNDIGFYNGINKNFPPIVIEKGYLEDKRFYYVLLHYEIRQRYSVRIK